MDRYCAVCGEPWDAAGVRRDGTGDMASYEAEMLLRGDGCPSCKGVPPEGADPAKTSKAWATSMSDNWDDAEGDQDLLLL